MSCRNKLTFGSQIDLLDVSIIMSKRENKPKKLHGTAIFVDTSGVSVSCAAPACILPLF